MDVLDPSIEAKTAAAEVKVLAPASFTADGILQPEAQAFLQQVLPGYIEQQRWFGSKSRTISSVRVASSARVPSSSAALTTVEVSYKNEPSTTAEVYQIPMAVASGAQADDLRVNSPRAVIASLDNSQKGPVLFDATAEEGFRKALLRMVAENDAKAAKGEEPALLGTHSSELKLEPLLEAATRRTRRGRVTSGKFFFVVHQWPTCQR